MLQSDSCGFCYFCQSTLQFLFGIDSADWTSSEICNLCFRQPASRPPAAAHTCRWKGWSTLCTSNQNYQWINVWEVANNRSLPQCKLAYKEKISIWLLLTLGQTPRGVCSGVESSIDFFSSSLDSPSFRNAQNTFTLEICSWILPGSEHWQGIKRQQSGI